MVELFHQINPFINVGVATAIGIGLIGASVNCTDSIGRMGFLLLGSSGVFGAGFVFGVIVVLEKLLK